MKVPEATLVEWVWLTTYLEYFTGLSGDKVTRQINFIRSGVLQGRMALDDADLPVLDAIPQKIRFDYRSARSRAWMVLLANIADREMRGSGGEIIRAFGRTALLPGIPRERFLDPDLYFSAGNRFLIIPNEIEIFRHQLFDHPGKDFLAWHGIGDEISLLIQGWADSFVNQRLDRLFGIEFERVEHFWGGVIYPPEEIDENVEIIETVKSRLAAELTNKKSYLYLFLKESLADHIRNAVWSVGDIYGSGSYRVEAEVSEAELDEFDVDKTLIRASTLIEEPGQVIVHLAAKAEVIVQIDVAYFVWDSIDKDEFQIVGLPLSMEISRDMSVSLISSGITSLNSPEEWSLEAEIYSEEGYEVDVGEVELDLGDHE
jgi:hypothetical protein